MLANIIIPITDHMITLIFQPTYPVLVIFNLILMPTAISFKDQPHFHTKEIGEVGANGMLLTKSIVPQVAVSERVPQFMFCWG